MHAQYIRALERWPAAMRRYFYTLPDDPEAACFGPGDHGHWSLQANTTAAAALAVLAVAPAWNARRAGMPRAEILARALRLIRFTCRSHHAGGGTATDLKSWGHSWISALCLERMMPGVDALGPALPERERALLERVMVSESDWLLDHHPCVAGLTKNNKPESNIWNGCLLLRTARMAPHAPRRAEYEDKGTRFLLNGISVPADASDARRIAGRPLSDWHVGANMFPTMACNHHGYLNIGYMAICLSNIALLHFSCRARGWPVPDGLYHHVRELWQLVKTCTFPDGRLWRIGGDTRVRYCYCQDYAVPAWLLARDLFGDRDTEAFERGWLDIVSREMAAPPDRAFLSTRLRGLEAISPLYYCRLEGDRAASLAMGAWWHRLLVQQPARRTAEQRKPVPFLATWSDAYHGSVLARGKKRFASWTWRAAAPPQGVCVPPEKSCLAEWQGNLAACIRGMGVENDAVCRPGQSAPFAGGFAACGQVIVHTRLPVCEGDTAHDAAAIDLACVALPDDRTVVVLQRARVFGRTWLRAAQGLFLQIPNDVFNGMRRVYRHAGGCITARGCPGRAEQRPIPGDWLNIDGVLSAVRVYGPGLVLHRPPARQIFIRPAQHTERAGGTLYADEICCGCRMGAHAVDAHSTLFDLGAVLLTGMTAETTVRFMKATPPERVPTGHDHVRGIDLTGADQRRYRVLVNFIDQEAQVSVARGDGKRTRIL